MSSKTRKTSKNTYGTTKEDLMAIVTNLKSIYGNEIILPIISVDQAENIEMYTTSIRTDLSFLLFQRVPRDYNNTEGLQRALRESKVENIKELCETDSSFTSPGSLVANLEVKERSWGVRLHIDPYSKKATQLIIFLTEIENRLKNAEVDQDGFILDQESFMLGYLIDSHHRTSGFWNANKPDFQLPSTIYLNLPHQVMHQIFVYINFYQEKPSPVHTLVSRALGGLLLPEADVAFSLIENLNSNSRSILRYRIKDLDATRPKYLDEANKIKYPPYYVTASTFHNLLIKEVFIALAINKMTQNELFSIFNNYFTAWSNVFPEAWKYEKKHILVKSMGFQIMLKLFNDITNYAKQKYSKTTSQLTSSEYEYIIRQLLGQTTDSKTNTLKYQQLRVILESGRFTHNTLDWSSEEYGSYSNGKGINQIVRSLKKHMLDREDILANIK